MRIKKFNEMFDPMGSWDPSQLDNTEKQVSGLIDKLIEQLPEGVKVESSGDKDCQLIVNYGPSEQGYRNFLFNISIVDGSYVVIYEAENGITDNLGHGSLYDTLSIIETWNDLE